jgi:hypothetical protein
MTINFSSLGGILQEQEPPKYYSHSWKDALRYSSVLVHAMKTTHIFICLIKVIDTNVAIKAKSRPACHYIPSQKKQCNCR